jgi:uncharacterized protein (TIGR00299 family) protein
MKLAYFDCIAGASGDMILGAMLDAGLPEETLRQGLATLHLADFSLDCQKVMKNGIRATKVDVIVNSDVPERHLHDIEALLSGSSLPDPIRQRALSIFRRLAEVEAGVHNQPVEGVHLHELGGVDTIIDVIGALLGLDALGVEKITASPLPLGRGFTHSAHGMLPLPAPATVMLLKGVPVRGSEIEKELVTPTGAVLLTSLAESFGPIPTMTLNAVGYGAGGWDLPIPNVLRLLLGEAPSSAGKIETETLVMLETNVDNQNPEFFEHTMQRLFRAGALDVFFSDIQMKKNRPATMLHVLCRAGIVSALSTILFSETSTLGIRQQTITRQALPREIRQVDTPYGPVRVKIAWWEEGKFKAAPEYEDCRRLAEQHGVPLREIYRAAEQAADHATGFAARRVVEQETESSVSSQMKMLPKGHRSAK